MHDRDGKPSAAWALATASTTSERSPGVMTAIPSRSRSSTWSAVIPATSTLGHLAFAQLGVAADRCPVHGLLQFGHRRRRQQRLFGQHIAARREHVQRLGDRGEFGRRATVGHHRRGVGMLGGQFGQAHLDDTGDLVGGAAFGAHRQQHRRAEVDRDPGVDRELGGAGDVGVVAADDHHRVARLRHRVIAVDDVGDRGVGVGVQLLVGHADALLVGQPGGGMLQQQFQDVVAVLTEPGDRPEHTDFGDRRGQSVQQPQRDRRLAGLRLGRRDVDR